MKMKVLSLFVTMKVLTLATLPMLTLSFVTHNAPRSNQQCGKSDEHEQSCSWRDLRGGASSFRHALSKRTVAYLISPGVASVLAGSIAGAVGVGVAFPLDTLKTKAQVISQTPTSVGSEAALEARNGGMLAIISYLYQTEGISGFYGGVKGVMLGQAFIKALAFSANQNALTWLEPVNLPNVLTLLMAACFAGFVTSFLVTPVERLKVMLQATTGVYKNEFQCFQAIVKTEGITGFLTRGLGATLTREIPSYGIYFWIYGFMMSTNIASVIGPAAPLVFGALSGMGAWLPVYPVDVVKTLLQNTEGTCKRSAMDITRELYAEGGIGAFFDGLTPKMLRAAINHAVTFYVYDLVLQALTGQTLA
jgi:hypothetical protein